MLSAPPSTPAISPPFPALCAEDVVFLSPIAHKPYVGREMLGVILGAVSRVFEDLRYVREIGGVNDPDHALVFMANVGDLEINGCDFLHIGSDGRGSSQPRRVVDYA